MICYKDKTFCDFNDCVKFNDCPDALTNQVRINAIYWWGKDDAPIMQYMDKPPCHLASRIRYILANILKIVR